MTDTAPGLTVAILTLNESRRIERCIQSANVADEIVVIDSGSTDDTEDIARRNGAVVVSYPDWQGFAEQRNRALKHCHGKYVFFLDADEELTPELRDEISAIVASGASGSWEVLWNQVAYGRPLTWMKSTGGVQRLFVREDLLGFDGVVHERAVLKNAGRKAQTLNGKLMHYSRETVYGSLQKLAQYAQLGALKRHKAGRRGGVLRGFASAFASFMQLYVFRRGFLCGPEGFLFCFFIALECFFRYAMLHYDRDTLADVVKR